MACGERRVIILTSPATRHPPLVTRHSQSYHNGGDMNLLAVETSEISGSVAVWRNGYLETEHFLGSAQRSAQSLAPAIRSVLTAAGLTPRDISCVAATVGPGSFTGLRVGVMTAKMFAYAVGASVAAVDTLLAIATGCNVPDFFEKTVSIAIDAQRKQVVAQSFHLRKSGGLYTKKPPDAPPIALCRTYFLR